MSRVAFLRFGERVSLKGVSFMRKYLGTAMGLVLVASLSACGSSGSDAPAPVAKGDLEKPVVKLGFIKLTDMAPLGHRQGKGVLR